MQMRICTRSSRLRCRIFAFLITGMLSLTGFAIEVDDLYVAEVLVADESPAQLRAGSRAGLLQVLVRVSGDVQVQERALVKKALRRSADYYYQYSYETTERTLLVNGEEVSAQLLQLHFEPSAVARLLRDAELPVWGSNRPGVLFWIAVNDGDGRRILNETDATGLVTSLIEQAERRGLPVLLPILDLEDTSRISTAEVWGAFLERIAGASDRYEPDAVVTARIQKEVGRWLGKWSYRLDEEWYSVESTALSVSDLLQQLVDRVADQLAARYALDASKATIAVTIDGIANLQDYAAVSAYLEKLTPVLSSTVVSLQSDMARYELRIEGQVEQLVEIIELDERLILVDQTTLKREMHYRWQRP